MRVQPGDQAVFSEGTSRTFRHGGLATVVETGVSGMSDITNQRVRQGVTIDVEEGWYAGQRITVSANQLCLPGSSRDLNALKGAEANGRAYHRAIELIGDAGHQLRSHSRGHDAITSVAWAWNYTATHLALSFTFRVRAVHVLDVRSEVAGAVAPFDSGIKVRRTGGRQPKVKVALPCLVFDEAAKLTQQVAEALDARLNGVTHQEAAALSDLLPTG